MPRRHRAPHRGIAERLAALVPQIATILPTENAGAETIGLGLDARQRPQPMSAERVRLRHGAAARLLVTVDDTGNGSGVGAAMREFATGRAHLALTPLRLLGVVFDGTSSVGLLAPSGVVIAFSWDLEDVHSIAHRTVPRGEEATVMCVAPDAALELRADQTRAPAGEELTVFVAELAACAARRYVLRAHHFGEEAPRERVVWTRPVSTDHAPDDV